MNRLTSTMLLLLLRACTFHTPVDEVLLELPAYSTTDIIIEHKGFILSYDPENRIPRWVAYELTDEETRGSEERRNRTFKMDPELGSDQAMREDYAGSGWTRGHIAPAADFRWDGEAMDQTFYLSNICPQNETLNAGDWEYLERKVRNWARTYGKVWVVSGPIIGDNIHGHIGQREVTVPDAFFKAIMAYDGMRYTAVAFIMGNDGERYYLNKCAMSIDELEAITGLDLFAAMDDDIEAEIERSWNGADWGIR